MVKRDDQSWRDAAACKGLAVEQGSYDLFFEEDLEPQAKKVCQSCNVRLDCLGWALRNCEHMPGGPHVVGGMNPKERERAYRRFLYWSNKRQDRERSKETWVQWLKETA